MRRHLLSILAIGALFASSCKKANEFTETQLQGENQRIANTGTGPTAVTTPTVYFMKGDKLWSITNLTAATPTLKDEGPVTNIEIYNNIQRTNVFNAGYDVIYNPFTDRMLTIDWKNVLHKCFIPTRGTATTTIPHTNGPIIDGPLTPYRVGPDQKLYYIAVKHIDEGPSDPIEEKRIGDLCRINMDGTGKEVLYTFDEYSLGEQIPAGGDINFSKNVLYSRGGYGEDYIYEKPMGLGSKKILVSENDKLPILTDIRLDYSQIKYNAKNKMLYFTGKFKNTNTIRIYSMNPAIGKTSVKQIFEMANCSSFNFTVSEATNTIVWCKTTLTPNGIYPSPSVVGKVNVDGTNAKILTSGNFTTNNVVAADPLN